MGEVELGVDEMGVNEMGVDEMGSGRSGNKPYTNITEGQISIIFNCLTITFI